METHDELMRSKCQELGARLGFLKLIGVSENAREATVYLFERLKEINSALRVSLEADQIQFFIDRYNDETIQKVKNLGIFEVVDAQLAEYREWIQGQQKKKGRRGQLQN